VRAKLPPGASVDFQSIESSAGETVKNEGLADRLVLAVFRTESVPDSAVSP
jgi:hypothetical protein